MNQPYHEIKNEYQIDGVDKAIPMGIDLDVSRKNQRRSVLIVDDDPDFVNLTKIILSKAGFDVASALNCDAAIEKCADVLPDVILLDLMMPQSDGFETYEKLKLVTQAPVIMITANGNRDNAVRSLTMGMEDYITKPFYNAEMVARIQSVMHRSMQNKPPVMKEFPDIGLLINFDTHEILLRKKVIKFVPREFEVFSMLALHSDNPVRYSQITEKIWAEDSSKNRTHLKNIIFAIRRKMEVTPEKPELIINYRSIGYLLVTRTSSARFA